MPGHRPTLTYVCKMYIHKENFNIGLSDITFGYNLQTLQGNKYLNTVINQAKYYTYKFCLNEQAVTIMGFLDQYVTNLDQYVFYS